MTTLEGFLCIDKPAGLTSRDVVNRIQRWIRPNTVGHAGTLDPLATGVLVVGVGRGTKLISYVQRMEKTYTARFQLGITSDTEDISGICVPHTGYTAPTREEVESACDQQVGEILQQPPRFSALRVQGRRAYQLARAGDNQFDLAPRPIKIRSIDITSYDFPLLELVVHCGSGTYVRSLGRDIGEILGCGSVMIALRRNRIGLFSESTSIPLAELGSLEDVGRVLLSMSTAIAELPSWELDRRQCEDLQHGRKLILPAATGEELAAFNESGKLVAVLIPDSVAGPTCWRSAVNLPDIPT